MIPGKQRMIQFANHGQLDREGTTGSFPLGKHPNVPMMQIHQTFRDEQAQTWGGR